MNLEKNKTKKFIVNSYDELENAQNECKSIIASSKSLEACLKIAYRKWVKEGRLLRSEINQKTKIRRFYEKEYPKIKKRFMARYRAHRKWSSENPVVALERAMDYEKKK